MPATVRKLRAGTLPPELRRADVGDNEAVYVTVETQGEHTARLFREIGADVQGRRREAGMTDADVEALLEELGLECRDE
ncbi:hypothetical protein [Azospirillum sp.]|uniref:hypothetical protein n=1 Tax=Azospirillum sp. TaxID=34012 RepID=UPI002D66DECB|nr:hypothetical protein [Azospirillum sp.]HYD69630.1 hypothetical protein [Azospirillum sp.]